LNNTEFKQGLFLGGSASIAFLVIFLAFKLTSAPIQEAAQSQLQNNLQQLLISGSYDNNPAKDVIYLTDLALGNNEPHAIYRASENGVPTGVVVSAIATDGYNGDINLLVGLTYSGELVAVRVTAHNETPGLGDDIDIQRSDWITAFNGLALNTVEKQQWQVKKDGGRFDQFTGATITPRAIVHSVHRVLQWYQLNRVSLFQKFSDN